MRASTSLTARAAYAVPTGRYECAVRMVSTVRRKFEKALEAVLRCASEARDEFFDNPRFSPSLQTAAVDALLARHEARRIVFLGDFLHAPEARAASTLDALAAWRRAHADVELLLVRGNHDRRAGDPPAWLGARCVDEPHGIAGAAGLHLSHHPRHVDGALVVAGHVHPCTFAGRGFERMRLPCFHVVDGCLTLPAFGAFTGMHPIERAEDDRVFVVAGDRVVELRV